MVFEGSSLTEVRTSTSVLADAVIRLVRADELVGVSQKQYSTMLARNAMHQRNPSPERVALYQRQVDQALVRYDEAAHAFEDAVVRSVANAPPNVHPDDFTTDYEVS